LSNDPVYRLKMRGPKGFARVLVYKPMSSDMIWEDTGEKVALDHTGIPYRDGVEFTDVLPVHPSAPATKSRNVGLLKIQLGLKCNYTCQYCSQAHQPKDLQGNLDDVRDFLVKLPQWMKSHPQQIEFWGGEPFAYWKTLKPLAEALRKRYPKAHFGIVTNGSLLDDEKNEWLDTLGFSVTISHDGPAMKYRGPDPLCDPKSLEAIRKLYSRLARPGRISFNTVLHAKNMSLGAVRTYIAEKLMVPDFTIPLQSEEIALPYDAGGARLSLRTEKQHRTYMDTVFWECVSNGEPAIGCGTIRNKLSNFFQTIAEGRPASSVGQKCGMDDPRRLAVDLKGNALTCQNMSADTKHRIGSIEAFEDIRLNTAYHWSTREECVKCPVVQLCQGACLFLEDDLWRQACDNSFTHNVAMLAAALYWLTRLILVEIEGPARRGGTMTMKVIEPPAEPVAA
jgi:uncharacterized protein